MRRMWLGLEIIVARLPPLIPGTNQKSQTTLSEYCKTEKSVFITWACFFILLFAEESCIFMRTEHI